MDVGSLSKAHDEVRRPRRQVPWAERWRQVSDSHVIREGSHFRRRRKLCPGLIFTDSANLLLVVAM
jgi:hypothetical protein